MSPRRAHPLRDFSLAVTTLTVLPLRVRWPEGGSTDAPGYYPLVGAGLGLTVWSAAWLSSALGWSNRAPLLIGAALVAVYALMSRMLHWDGLADVADSFGASERSRRLEIMRDSATGAFGVTAVALGVVLQAAAVAQLLQGRATWALVAVPVFGRLAATFAAWFGRPARAEGLGASVTGRPHLPALVPAALVSGAVLYANTLILGVAGLWLFAVGVALALVVPHLVGARFGGVTGDVIGASVVVVETVLFATFALMQLR